jgi:hypothetical protein
VHNNGCNQLFYVGSRRCWGTPDINDADSVNFEVE